jgi:predicted esterase
MPMRVSSTVTRPTGALLAVLAVLASRTVPARADADANSTAREVRIAPAPDGRAGTWLVLGPFHSATFGTKRPAVEALAHPPDGVDESHLVPREGTLADGSPATPPAAPRPHPARGAPKGPAAWSLASANEGMIDLVSFWHDTEPDLVAYVAGTLHVARAGRYYLLVGADDGIRVQVDGRTALTRDESRPARDDDDMVPLDLTAGDHDVLLKLHQREGGWHFGVRIVGETLRAPEGAWVTLPGTTPAEARDLAAHASWVSLDRGAGADGYHPSLTVKFLEGAPHDVPLTVRASLVGGGNHVFDVNAGEVPLGDGELTANLPPIVGDQAGKLEDADYVYEIEVAGRQLRLPFSPRRSTRDAIAHADHALSLVTDPPPPWLHDGTVPTIRNLRERLARLVDHGDADLDAQRAEAKELDDDASALDHGTDPYDSRTGPMRRAYRSPVDDGLQEFGLYVPPSYTQRARKRWPLVIALHGLNGRPMAMLRYFFGGDIKSKDAEWEDRHWAPPPVKAGVTVDEPAAEELPSLDAFVVTPSGHGNAMYRDLGEDDVLRVLDWARRAYPIDPDRITITGPSMGGIGTAAVAFRHPDLFAAAAPLCGYHSYFVRRDVVGRPMRPWERLLAEERSNVEWAVNGENLPLWIVHGTQDTPVANSGVLIDRYEKLGYSIIHDNPDLGHNVWQTTYEGLRGAKWLLSHTRVAHPKHLHFRTARLRDGDDAWVHVRELAGDVWGEVEAAATSRTSLTAATHGVAALSFDRDPALTDPAGELTVTIDGTAVPFAANEPVVLHREGGAWVKGPATHDGIFKQGDITGPLRDAFHAPLLFVYGASDPAQTRANEEVAAAWASIRRGTSVKYPVMSDLEFQAQGEPLANDRALFLVGNARSNAVVRALEGDLPIRIEGNAVVLGGTRITGAQVGAAFIRPNPRRPDRYLVVVEGVDALGTWRSLSLPDLLPDFVVWDEQVAPSRGQVLLGSGLVRAGGFFGGDWSLPEHVDDPLASRVRPAAKSEYDATPYLP